MTDFPAGTITFLFTDLEGSTQLWEKHPLAMQAALARHDEILKTSVHEHGGRLIKTTGDGIHAVFSQAHKAIDTALTAQLELNLVDWGETGPLKVRMGIHTGEGQFRDGDYYGPALNRAARIMGLGHGGQVLLSSATYLLASATRNTGHIYRDLGEHALKGITDREQIYQVSTAELMAEFPPLDSSTFAPHNLPQQLTSFFGREAEIAALTALFRDGQTRLVTMTGPGGTGKTRLSLEVARLLLDEFPDGIFFVQLAPITDPQLVPTTIARTIGLREGGGLPPRENLTTYLRNRSVLLVLDNLEQVIDAAGMLAEILAQAPNLKFFVTSRIPLQVYGEHEFFLSPLGLPEAHSALSGLETSPAVQLFLARAGAVKAGFRLTQENAAVVAEICRRLDGLPLALEIAAARLRMLSPQAILNRLDNRLNLLTRVSRDLPERQQTMRAAIDWSYDLLEPDIQQRFSALSIFVGGFTLEAAEQVCDPEGAIDLFSAVETLVSNSLVHLQPTSGDEPRFSMLQTIQDYAQEKLSASAGFAEIRARHGRYFAHLLDQSAPGFYSADANVSLDRVELEYDNLRAAMKWAVETPDTFHLAAQMVFNIFWFWYRHGHIHEGREWTERIIENLTNVSQPYLAGLSLITAGMMAMWEGDLTVADQYSAAGLEYLREAEETWPMGAGLMSAGVIKLNRGEDAAAYPLLEAAIHIFQEIGNQWFVATTMVHLANVALGLGNPEEAWSLLDQAQVLSEQIGDPWLRAFAANNRGEVARVERNFGLARQFYEETSRQYALADAKGDQARLVYTFGYLEMHAGDYTSAKACFRESLSDFLALGNRRGIAECLAALAGLAAVQGRSAWAAPLLAAAEGILEESGAAWWPADRVEIEGFKALLAEAGVAEEADLIGGSLQAAVDYARGGPDTFETPGAK